jgi:TIR domain
MNYEKDLFISYAHLDNEPLTPEQQGWVSQFHESLERALTWSMGHKAAIWRDQKLSGNDIFAKEIVEQFSKVALLVSVLSPCYMESEWCRREVEEFCKAAEQNGKIVVDNKSRIIKVIKRPPKSQAPLPSFMKEMLGYDFYVYKDDSPLELDPAWGDDLAQQFNRKIVKLADDIAQLIERLDATALPAPSLSPLKPAIYLAQCSRDRKEARDALFSELQLHGYPVFPDKPLHMDDEESFVSEVQGVLTQCSLSIHLVGSSYGAIPDGQRQKSVVVLENELAVAQSKRGHLRRIIWLPDGTVPKSPEQQQFIEALGRDPEAQYGADLITTGIETLKCAVHNSLQKLERPELQPAKQACLGSGSKLIYLIYDKNDRESTRRLRKCLMDKGFEVDTPVFEGDAATVRQANQETLAQCNAAILFYGSGDEAWKHTVVNDLKKANGYRGDKPPFISFTYLSSPATDDKKDMIELEQPNLINGLEGFSEAAIQPLLDALWRA